MDECSLGIDGCEEVCENTVGSYKCSCTQGELSTNGKNCTGMCAIMFSHDLSIWYPASLLLILAMCMSTD